ncbi:MAG: FecR domain-containing protein [Bacteroidetes bacterium]|nr:FecR domain-containing protein [Bacteroidota bacterium]
MSEADYIQLVLKHLDSQADPAEQAALQTWLEADPQNRLEYQALEKIWNDSGTTLAARSFDVEAALEKVRGQLDLTTGTVHIRPWKKALAAASVALIIGAAGWWIRAHSGTTQTSIHADTANQTVTLPDGSLVHLRKGATLSYAAGLTNRTVELTGEAFFEPRAGAATPFRIRTERAVFQDIGTSFLVNDRLSEDELTVITGKVKFSDKANPSNSLTLTAGQKAMLSGSGFTSVTPTGDPNVLAWKTDILDFKDQPLGNVAADIADYYQTAIAIDPKLAKIAGTIRVTARFEHQPLKEVLEEVRLMTGLSMRKEKDTFILTEQSPVPHN